MGFGIVILIPIFVFLLALWMACGMLLIFTRPEGIRPPWWDWGMDKIGAKTKTEPAHVEEVPAVVETPLVVEPEIATKAARPRW